MLRGYSGAGILNNNLRTRDIGRDRDLNCPPGRSETQRVFDEITHGPTKKRGIGMDISFSATRDSCFVFFRDWFIEYLYFLDRVLSVEKRSLDMTLSGLRAREKEQVVDNRGEPFAFS